MDGETPPLQASPDLEQFRDLLGLVYSPPSSPMCRSRRSMKRDESKETYKLPHRLIEKKRRDRINECIAQLKDLLPEHLKLTTLGHLEKAVVLELTLKHIRTLTALTEQQHQKIIALQNGDRSPKSPPQSDLDAFQAGFQTCTKEVLHYLSRWESWTSREQRCLQLLGHLHAVCRRFLPGSPPSIPKLGGAQGRCSPREGPQQQQQAEQHPPGETLLKQERSPLPHCVPVIQRTHSWGRGAAAPHLPPSISPDQAGEQDTDTDSGYGGEAEGKTPQAGWVVKREPAGDGEATLPEGSKRRRLESHSPSAAPEQGAGVMGRPEPTLLNPLGALGVGASGGLGGSLLGQAPTAPFCLPFYFIAPSAAYMQPFLEKMSSEKLLHPAGGIAGPFPFLYPGIPIQGAAAVAALPSLVLAAAEKGGFPGEGAPTAQPPAQLPPPASRLG